MPAFPPAKPYPVTKHPVLKPSMVLSSPTFKKRKAVQAKARAAKRQAREHAPGGEVVDSEGLEREITNMDDISLVCV